MMMMKLQTCFLLVWMMIPTVITFGFDLQQQTKLRNSHYRSLLFSPSSLQQHQRLLLTRKGNYRRGFQMKPFWKSSSSSDENNDDDSNNKEAKDDEEEMLLPSEEMIMDSTSSSTTTSNVTISNKKEDSKNPGLIALINEIGQNFKPKAEKATANGYQADTQAKKIMYAIQASIYYSLFIVYRAYRGLFVLMPAVFRQVYQKMEAAMNSDNLSLVDPTVDSSAATPEKATWRTKITVSVLATVVTISYVLGGTIKMATRFVKSLTKSKSVPKSFEAAADEMVEYEGRISRIGKINGDDDLEPSGFAP
jgi:hypothetical protein